MSNADAKKPKFDYVHMLSFEIASRILKTPSTRRLRSRTHAGWIFAHVASGERETKQVSSSERYASIAAVFFGLLETMFRFSYQSPLRTHSPQKHIAANEQVVEHKIYLPKGGLEGSSRAKCIGNTCPDNALTFRRHKLSTPRCDANIGWIYNVVIIVLAGQRENPTWRARRHAMRALQAGKSKQDSARI